VLFTVLQEEEEMKHLELLLFGNPSVLINHQYTIDRDIFIVTVPLASMYIEAYLAGNG
jgi:hypothetical protein